jgi:orotate phosphoribosyltransferase
MDPLNVLVGQPRMLRYQTEQLAADVYLAESSPTLDEVGFIVANANRGMVVGWQLKYDLDKLGRTEMPFLYVRQSQKVAGHKELITGNRNNPLIEKGDRALIVEAESNPEIFVNRVLQSAEALREAGYVVNDVATLYAPNQDIKSQLEAQNLYLTASTSYLELCQDIKMERKAPLLPPIDMFQEDTEHIGKRILDTGALEIRDISAGQEPFLYSSGNKGPGSLMVKGLTGQPAVLKYLSEQLAARVAHQDFDFVAANVTGGLVPGAELRNYVERVRRKDVPFVYVEGTRRVDTGMKDLGVTVVGLEFNPLIEIGYKGIINEELVNFAQTTTNSAIALREIGFPVDRASTILSYNHQAALDTLEKTHVKLTPLITLQDLLKVAESVGKFDGKLVDDYKSYLADPKGWQLRHGITPLEKQKEDA